MAATDSDNLNSAVILEAISPKDKTEDYSVDIDEFDDDVKKPIIETTVDKTQIDFDKDKKQFAANLTTRNARSTFQRLLQLAKPESLWIILGTVALALSSGLFLVIPYIAGEIVDTAVHPGADASQKLFKSVLMLTGAIFVAALFATMRAYLYTIAGERTVLRLRNQLFASIMIQEVAFFDETKTGELLNRLASDCTTLQDTVTVNVSMGLRSALQMLAALVMLFYISWKLTLIILSIVPLIIVAGVVYGRLIKKIAKDYQDALAASADTANEAITNVRTVRSFAKEDFEIDRYQDKITATYQLARKKSIAFAIFTGVTIFFANFVIGGVLWYGGSLVISGELSVGSLTSFIIYTLSVASGVGILTGLYSEFMKALGASERVFQLLDRNPKVKWRGGNYPSSSKGIIEMKDVHFSYPARPDVEVLKGIDLQLKPGNVVALVGPSGGGKTTIVALLEMFYYPTKGKIYLDGVDIVDLDPKFLRSQIGLVSQEPSLFGTSIRENIAYGMKDVSIEKIEEAAKMANAHQFIKMFPQGYDTVVGERGIRLSGGQKQRVAIARAILLNPSILLLDEATSALDAESEYLVKEALDRIMKGRTVLVIAHRLSTVKNANLVCVIHHGKMIEQGTHDVLIAKPDGVYQKLVRRQLQNS